MSEVYEKKNVSAISRASGKRRYFLIDLLEYFRNYLDYCCRTEMG